MEEVGDDVEEEGEDIVGFEVGFKRGVVWKGRGGG